MRAMLSRPVKAWMSHKIPDGPESMPPNLILGEPMYCVTREIRFCYGHRLLHYDGKCRHLHGHNGRAVLTLQADRLDPLGMVMDFTRIKNLITAWIDGTLYH